ncbi:MAG: hypothetical protein WBK91_08085 [Alphaproteobacteria bacterium]
MAQPNPIITQFRAAGKLINEWRDTLSLGVLGAAISAGVVNPDIAVSIFVGREACRAMSWRHHKEPLYVGAKTHFDNLHLAHSANVVTLAALAGAATLNGDFAFAGAMLVPNAVSLMKVGGCRAVLDAYGKVMWDYPRKKDDGGTTQTQKLKDGGKELLQQLVDQVTPAPTPVPVPVRSHSTAPSASRPSFSARFKN